MIDLAKLRQELRTAATANELVLEGVYVHLIVKKSERQQSSQQWKMMALLESTKTETELATEIIGQMVEVFKADEPHAMKAELEDLRAQLAQAKSANVVR